MARSLRDLRAEITYFREMKGQVVISPRAQSIKQPAYDRSRDIESRLVGSEAVLYRLRRDYAAKGDLSGSLGTRDSLEPVLRRKVKRLSPKHEVNQHLCPKENPKPVLGVNLERSKTEEKKPLQDSGFTARGKPHIKPASTSQKLTTVKLGLDLPQNKHTADLQILEQKMRAWLSYQQDIREVSPTKRSERLNPATCSRTEIKLLCRAKDPQPRTKRERRNRSYELLPDTEVLIPAKAEDKLAALFTPPSLAPNQHSGLPKPPPLKLTAKKREQLSGASTDKGLLPAELPSPPSDPAYHFPRLRKVMRPPAHTLPSYRLAVDYNLFRFVYKHKDRVVTQA